MNPTLLPLPPGGRRGGGGGYFAYGAEAAAILPAAAPAPRAVALARHKGIAEGRGPNGGGGRGPAWDLAACQRGHLVLSRVPRVFSPSLEGRCQLRDRRCLRPMGSAG